MEETLFLMVGSSSNKKAIEPKRGKGLAGIRADFQKFILKFKHQLHNYLETSSHNDSTLYSKDDILQWLENNLEKYKGKLDAVFLFYAGHGHEKNGNLLIDSSANPEGQQIDLEQIIKIWRKKKPKNDSRLVIFADSCHSGQLCYRLGKTQKQNISIFASCRKDLEIDDKEYGGLFFSSLFANIQQDFEKYYQALAEFHPTFISLSDMPMYLTKQHLVSMRKDIMNALKIVSKESEEDEQKQKINQTDWKVYYKDGSYYIGELKQDERDGDGIFYCATGEVYNGKWKGGLMHGMGQYKLLNGFVYIGTWKEGDLENGWLKYTVYDEKEEKQILKIEIKYPEKKD